jgi:hypothetical protein
MSNELTNYLNKHADMSKVFLTSLSSVGFYFGVTIKTNSDDPEKMCFFSDPSVLFAIAITALVFTYLIDYLNAVYFNINGKKTSITLQILAIIAGLISAFFAVAGVWSLALIGH